MEVSPPARTQTVQSVLHALMSVGRLIRQRGQAETLDPGAFWLLKTVSMNGSMRVTDLASSANLDTSTVSRHVAQLHKVGWIERTSGPGRPPRPTRTPQRGRSLDTRPGARRSHRCAGPQSGGAGVKPISRSSIGWSPACVTDVESLSQKLEQS